MAKILLFVGALLTPGTASACWTCAGLTDEECRKQIEEGRLATVEWMAKIHARSCVSQGAGVQSTFGISTAGSFAITCDGKNGGCLYWADGDETHRYTPLGETASCDEARNVYEQIPEKGQNRPRTNPAGEEISYLE
jgi:hypothetical protein